MRPHIPEKTDTCCTDKQWKVEAGTRTCASVPNPLMTIDCHCSSLLTHLNCFQMQNWHLARAEWATNSWKCWPKLTLGIFHMNNFACWWKYYSNKMGYWKKLFMACALHVMCNVTNCNALHLLSFCGRQPKRLVQNSKLFRYTTVNLFHVHVEELSPLQRLWLMTFSICLRKMIV